MPIKESGKANRDAAQTAEAVAVTPTGAPPGAVEARQIVANLVRARAGEIALGAIGVATQGQLAHVKYLFELAGIYSGDEGARTTEVEESVTYDLLSKLGLSADPENRDNKGQAKSAEKQADYLAQHKSDANNEDQDGHSKLAVE